jgi:hypothetical protein
VRGHIRRRGKTSFEYIVDIGIASAQRCQDCGRRFWVERKPKGGCDGPCLGAVHTGGPALCRRLAMA